MVQTFVVYGIRVHPPQYPFLYLFTLQGVRRDVAQGVEIRGTVRTA